MEAVVDGRHRQARADRRLHDRRQDRHRVEADRRPLLGDREQRLVRRLRAVAEPGGRDHRGDRRAARQRQQRRGGRRADLQPHRRGGAALPRRAADDQSRAAGAGRPQRSGARWLARSATTAPVVTLVSDAGPPGDARPARPERARRDAHAGEARAVGAPDRATASSSSQDPPPGAPFEGGEPAGCNWAGQPATRTADACHDLGRASRRAPGKGAGSQRRRHAGGGGRGRRDGRSPTTRARWSPATCSSR